MLAPPKGVPARGAAAVDRDGQRTRGNPRDPRKTLPLDGLRSALQHIAGDRDHAFEHGLGAARARPRSEIASRACEHRALRAQTVTTQTPRVRNPATIRYSPNGALAQRFTCSPRARITATSAPATGRVTTARAAVRLRAEQHATCSARAGELRSTPERACFTTCPETALACAVREVTLYLAVPSPLFPRRPPAGPITDPSSVLREVPFRARHRTALRPGLESETSSIIGLAQGRAPNTELPWPPAQLWNQHRASGSPPAVPRRGEGGPVWSCSPRSNRVPTPFLAESSASPRSQRARLTYSLLAADSLPAQPTTAAFRCEVVHLAAVGPAHCHVAAEVFASLALASSKIVGHFLLIGRPAADDAAAARSLPLGKPGSRHATPTTFSRSQSDRRLPEPAGATGSDSR
jgi:hypothetical protein